MDNRAAEPVTPCPRCGCRAVSAMPPDPQRIAPGFLCQQCGIERADLDPFDAAPELPPCPVCGSRVVHTELVRRVQFALIGPPIVYNEAHFTCGQCDCARDEDEDA